MHRWTGNNLHRLHLPGAQPREEHLRGHFVHAPQVQRWMDGFMTAWLRGTAGPRGSPTELVNMPGGFKIELQQPII